MGDAMQTLLIEDTKETGLGTSSLFIQHVMFVFDAVAEAEDHVW